MAQVKRAVLDDDITAFVRGWQREPWLLGEACAWFQAEIIGCATLNDREPFIVALLNLDPDSYGANRRPDREPSSSRSPTPPPHRETGNPAARYQSVTRAA